MNLEELIEAYAPLLKRNWIPLCLGVAGVIFFVYGLIGSLGYEKDTSNVIFEDSNSASSGAILSSKISVDIEGSVVNPGVYEVNSDSRIQDALIAAGGLSVSADREWVSKNLNLAQKVTDAQKIYIPKVGDTSSNVLGAAINSSGLVSINNGSQKDLDGLPGVGVVIATKIINGRPYSALEDLLNRKIVSEKVFGQIKDKITLY